MLTIKRNNYYDDLKESAIFTPPPVAKFIYETVKPHIDFNVGPVIDPACGAGALLKPFETNNIKTIGIDLHDHNYPNLIQKDFLSYTKSDAPPKPSFVVANPPFNVNEETKGSAYRFFGGRPLLPEVFLYQIIELWGAVPIAIIVPHGLRLNLGRNSRRRNYFLRGKYHEIVSIITLPKDVFENIIFHCEILIFNINGLKPHYFYYDLDNESFETEEGGLF